MLRWRKKLVAGKASEGIGRRGRPPSAGGYPQRWGVVYRRASRVRKRHPLLRHYYAIQLGKTTPFLPQRNPSGFRSMVSPTNQSRTDATSYTDFTEINIASSTILSVHTLAFGILSCFTRMYRMSEHKRDRTEKAIPLRRGGHGLSVQECLILDSSPPQHP